MTQHVEFDRVVAALSQALEAMPPEGLYEIPPEYRKEALQIAERIAGLLPRAAKLSDQLRAQPPE